MYQTMLSQLNKHEMAGMKLEGETRWNETRYANHGKGAGKYAKDATFDIRGARAELAVGKALNLYGGYAPAAEIDVGGLIETRSWRDPVFGRNSPGHLIIKPDDHDVPFVMVACDQEDKGIFQLNGWMHAVRARDTYPLKRVVGVKGETDPAVWIPRADLWPMSELVEWVGVQFLIKALARRRPVMIIQPVMLIDDEEDDDAQAI